MSKKKKSLPSKWDRDMIGILADQNEIENLEYMIISDMLCNRRNDIKIVETFLRNKYHNNVPQTIKDFISDIKEKAYIS